MLREGDEGSGTETLTFIRLMVPQGGSSIAGACVAPLGKSRRASPARARGGCEIDSLGRCKRQRIAPSNVGECVSCPPDAVCHLDG